MMSSAVLIGLNIVTLLALLLLLARLSRLTSGSAGNTQNLQDEMRSLRMEWTQWGKLLREEIAGSSQAAMALLHQNQNTFAETQRQQLKDVQDRMNQLLMVVQNQLNQMREGIEKRVAGLQEGNERKLEEMRRLVDEKLHESLEKRLGESFKIVSERLEAVHKGLGEMQNLAAGVGDLKRVLSNVKARGTWGEMQLGAILEQVLAPGQYERNVKVNPAKNLLVEYAVRLPGPSGEQGDGVWLPIDAKFPQEDYLRLQAAAEKADENAVQEAVRGLEKAILKAAEDIHQKYVCPPHSTDFAILFLPTEGLYAEVLRNPNLAGDLLVKHRVVPAGPTTMAAILSSLRLGFQTLAIQRRSAEVWTMLGAVKTEFQKFAEQLGKVKKNLNAAIGNLERTETRTRAITRALKNVEKLPENQVQTYFPETQTASEEEEGEED